MAGRTPLFSFETSTPSRTATESSRRGPRPRTSVGATPRRNDSTPSQEIQSGSGSTTTTDQLGNQRPSGDRDPITVTINKLCASSDRMEKMLNELTSSHRSEREGRSRVPKALSAIVRDAYSKLVDEEEMEWNYVSKYDDDVNEDINRTIIRNVLAVSKDYDAAQVKWAARTYFKTKKSAHKRKLTGREEANASLSRRRQRRHNKACARLRVLNLSTTLDDLAKQKIRPVLKPEFMSSEESVVEDTASENNSSDDSDGPSAPAHKKKKLVKHKLPWRSQECQSIIESLDRKIARRRDERAKRMCLETTMGGNSVRPKPDHLPEWASELFS